MTTTDDTTTADETAPDETPDQPTPEDTDPSGAPADTDAGKGGRDAARYRRQLRETEAQRDSLAARLDAAQRREVERLAGDRLTAPADLWLTGATVADFLDEHGDVDAGKLAGRLEHLLAERPTWRKRRFQGSADGGTHGSTPPQSRTFGDLLRGA